MAFFLKSLAMIFLLTRSAILAAGQSGSGTTTRYWDCCKPSCAWPMSGITKPVKTCDISDSPLTDVNAQSGCTGGTSYMCSDQSPYEVTSDLAYGFAAVSAASPNCCACYQLTFTSTVLAGKKLIVQATNTGDDVGATQFDLAIPGGGFGQFDACTKEWDATSAIWGQTYGGPSSNTCSSFPTALQPGCGFRWGWMQGADNPTVDWEVVTCPAELVAKSGCSVTGYNSGNAPSVPASSATAQAISAAYSKASTLTPATSSKAHGSMSASVAPVAPASVSASLEMPVTSATAPVPTSGAINAFSSVAPVHPAKVHRPHWVPHQYKAHEAADHGYEEETEQDDCDAF